MKVFVVHYKKLVKRKETILKQFEKFGITDYEFVDIDRSEIHKYDLSKIDQNALPVVAAVNLSHMYIYKKIAEKYQEALILEDDAIMVDDFMERFLQYHTELVTNYPYFDMLFLGNGCNLHIPAYKIIQGKHIYYKSSEPTLWGGDGVTRCVDSYLVSNKGAKKICTYIDNDTVPWGYGVDFRLNKIAREIGLEVYWAEPTIVSQSSENDPNDCRSY
jgi:GR25 family glycosyltransferase involved in LPS biosynthesis